MSRRNDILSKINPRFHAQIAAQTGGKVGVTPKPSIRQNRGGMNKTEARFLQTLRNTNPTLHIHREVSLPLANGVRYKLDFLVALPATDPVRPVSATVTGYEVKGYHRDDAIVKLKVAAKEYPWITFFLVHDRDGAWSFEQIFP